MLKAATMTIIVNIRKRIFFSTCNVSKNVLLRWRQSVIISGREMALSISMRKASICSGSSTKASITVTSLSRLKNACASASGI